MPVMEAHVKKKPSMLVHIKYRLLKKNPMPMPYVFHKWFLKKMPCPPSMTKSQYPTNIAQNLLLKTR
jgi:hypothetical protein